MPRYRYLASAMRRGDTWEIQVENFPGTVIETDDAKVVDAARSHAARHLGVSIEDMDIHVNYWRPKENVHWREVCDFWPEGEHGVQRQIFRGGTHLEALDAFRAWLAPYDACDHLLAVLTMTFNRYPGQEDGHAPIELDVVYERLEGDPLHNATHLASKVAAALAGRGVTARLTEESDEDTAALTVETHPEYRFVVTQQHDDRAWTTERAADTDEKDSSTEEIDSTLDGLGVDTPATQIADAIQGHLAGEPPPLLHERQEEHRENLGPGNPERVTSTVDD